MNLEGQDAAGFEAQRPAQGRRGLDGVSFGRPGRQNEHDLTTAHDQSQALLVPGITLSALA